MAEDDEYLDYRYELPPPADRTCGTYARYPGILLSQYAQRMRRLLGGRFLAFLGVTQLLVKGFLYTALGAALLPVFKARGADAASTQLYAVLAAAPWAAKPLLGIASDAFPIGGYRKRYWLAQALAVGVAGSALLLAAATRASAPAGFLVACFAAVNYEMAACDLLSEGRYAETMREHPRSGSDVVTLVNGMQRGGALAAMALVGPLADGQAFFPLYILTVLLCAAPVAPTLLGWLPEQRVEHPPSTHSSPAGALRERCGARLDSLRPQWRRLAVVAAVGLAGPLLALLAALAHPLWGLAGAAVMLAAAVGGAFAVFPPLIAHVALYQVLARVAKPSLSSALDYFFTADSQCLPGGPHFSFVYYVTFTGVLGTCVSFVAVWLYQLWMSRWRFRSVLVLTTALVGVSGLFDLLIVLRVNVRYLGIADRTFYVLGEAVLESAVQMFYWIPSSAVISKACPPRLESTTYAFLAGLANFAAMAADLGGVAIFTAAGVRSVADSSGAGAGGACDFSALWWLILVFHVALPVAVGVPAAWLVPNVPQNAPLDEMAQEQPAEGTYARLVEMDDATGLDDWAA